MERRDTDPGRQACAFEKPSCISSATIFVPACSRHAMSVPQFSRNSWQNSASDKAAAVRLPAPQTDETT